MHRAVGRRGRSLDHLDLLYHVGVKIALTHAAVLVGVVLAHAVAHYLDPVLAHAANDEGLGIAGTAEGGDARLVTEQVGDVAHHLLFNLFGGDDRDGAGDILQFLLHPRATDHHDFICFLVRRKNREARPAATARATSDRVLLWATANPY